MITVFRNATVFHGVSDDLREAANVIVEGDRIREVSTDRSSFPDERVMDCAGRFLTPGS